MTPRRSTGLVPRAGDADEPIALLVALLADGVLRGEVVHVAAADHGGRHAPAVRALLAAGLLRPDNTLPTVLCDACDEAHLVEVVHDPGRGGYGWHCIEAGFVATTAERVARLAINADAIATIFDAALTATFGPRRARGRVIDGAAARPLGVWTIANLATDVVLAGDLDRTAPAAQLAAHLAALPQRDVGLLLTVGPADGFRPPPGFAAIDLDAVIDIVDDQLTLDARPIVDAVTRVPRPGVRPHLGRPSMRPKIMHVLDALAAQGKIAPTDQGLSGIIRRAWPAFFAGEAPPQASTLRPYIRAWREAQAGDVK